MALSKIPANMVNTVGTITKNASNPAVNTGGGGGGAGTGYNSAAGDSAAGGSGIIIIKYKFQ